MTTNTTQALFGSGDEPREPVTIGDRVYFRGDMANHPWWARVERIGERGLLTLRIEGDAQAFGDELPLYAWQIHTIDRGHGGTRHVTESAYRAFRAQRLAESKAEMVAAAAAFRARELAAKASALAASS